MAHKSDYHDPPMHKAMRSGHKGSMPGAPVSIPPDGRMDGSKMFPNGGGSSHMEKKGKKPRY